MGNETEEHLCIGKLINSSDIGECLCSCLTDEFHYNDGFNTEIGIIIGIQFSETILILYLILFFVLLLIIFYTFYDYFLLLIKNMKRGLLKWTKLKNKRFHDFVLYLKIAESGWVILMGLMIGLLIDVTGLRDIVSPAPNTFLRYNKEVMFLILIPPIVLESAFFMKQKKFWNNFESILVHSIIGTIIDVVLVAFSLALVSNLEIIDCLIFASVISAVDHVSIVSAFKEISVNERFHVLVENASIFNDEISIILFQLFTSLKRENIRRKDFKFTMLLLFFLKFLYFTCFGIICGLICGVFATFLTRFTVKEYSKIFQVLVVVVFSFLSYLIADTFMCSGVVSLLACSLLMSRYMAFNLLDDYKLTLKNMIKIFSTISESMIFIYLGIDLLTYYHHNYDWFLIFMANIFVFVYRIIVVFILSYILNFLFCLFKMKKEKILPLSEIFVFSLTGMRGSIALALSFIIPHELFTEEEKDAFVTATFSVIIITIYINGTVISSLVRFFGIERKERTPIYAAKEIHDIIELTNKVIIFNPSDNHGRKVKRLFRKKMRKIFKQLKKEVRKLYKEENEKDDSLCDCSSLRDDEIPDEPSIFVQHKETKQEEQISKDNIELKEKTQPNNNDEMDSFLLQDNDNDDDAKVKEKDVKQPNEENKNFERLPTGSIKVIDHKAGIKVVHNNLKISLIKLSSILKTIEFSLFTVDTESIIQPISHTLIIELEQIKLSLSNEIHDLLLLNLEEHAILDREHRVLRKNKKWKLKSFVKRYMRRFDMFIQKILCSGFLNQEEEFLRCYYKLKIS